MIKSTVLFISTAVLCSLNACNSNMDKRSNAGNLKSESLLHESEYLSSSDNNKILSAELFDIARKAMIKNTSIAKDAVLFLRYDYTACSSCTDSLLKVINQTSDKNKIVTIVNYETEQQYNAWSADSQIPNRFWVKRGLLKLNSETSNNSYFFVYHPSTKRISDVFIPIKMLPDRTVKYLNMIYTRLHY